MKKNICMVWIMIMYGLGAKLMDENESGNSLKYWGNLFGYSMALFFVDKTSIYLFCLHYRNYVLRSNIMQKALQYATMKLNKLWNFNLWCKVWKYDFHFVRYLSFYRKWEKEKRKIDKRLKTIWDKYHLLWLNIDISNI
jgi:hypothetical protein